MGKNILVHLCTFKSVPVADKQKGLSFVTPHYVILSYLYLTHRSIGLYFEFFLILVYMILMSGTG